ncbi:hypothetical protein MRX96_059726 [Rhipicephalus microplus]
MLCYYNTKQALSQSHKSWGAGLGYWDLRGLGQPIRNPLVYKGVQFEDKRYKFVPAPDYHRGEWLREKYTLGLRFPNLPLLHRRRRQTDPEFGHTALPWSESMHWPQSKEQINFTMQLIYD